MAASAKPSGPVGPPLTSVFKAFNLVSAELAAIPRSDSLRFEAIKSGVAANEAGAVNTLGGQVARPSHLLPFLRAQLESAELLLAAYMESTTWSKAEVTSRDKALQLANKIVALVRSDLDNPELIKFLESTTQHTHVIRLTTERQHLKAMAAFAARLVMLLYGTDGGTRQDALNGLVEQLGEILIDPNETSPQLKALVARCKLWLTWRAGWSRTQDSSALASSRQSHLADLYVYHSKSTADMLAKTPAAAAGKFEHDNGLTAGLEARREASRAVVQPSLAATKEQRARLYLKKAVEHYGVARGDLEILITTPGDAAGLQAFETALISFNEQTRFAIAMMGAVTMQVNTLPVDPQTALAVFWLELLECQLRALQHDEPADPAHRTAIIYRTWSEAPLRLLAAAEAYEEECGSSGSMTHLYQAQQVAYQAFEVARKAAEMRGGRDAPYFSYKTRQAYNTLEKIKAQQQKREAMAQETLFFSDVVKLGQAAANRVTSVLARLGVVESEGTADERRPLLVRPGAQ